MTRSVDFLVGGGATRPWGPTTGHQPHQNPHQNPTSKRPPPSMSTSSFIWLSPSYANPTCSSDARAYELTSSCSNLNFNSWPPAPHPSSSSSTSTSAAIRTRTQTLLNQTAPDRVDCSRIDSKQSQHQLQPKHPQQPPQAQPHSRRVCSRYRKLGAIVLI